MKLKFNWGTSIVIAFALFIAFILYFVIKVQSDSKYDNDLVVEEYYKHDIHYQEEMQRVQNALELKNKPEIIVGKDEVAIVFSKEFQPSKIKGNVSFYRASNKKFDFVVPLVVKDSILRIAKQQLVPGNWKLNMEWQYEGKAYLTKESIYIQ